MPKSRRLEPWTDDAARSGNGPGVPLEAWQTKSPPYRKSETNSCGLAADHAGAAPGRANSLRYAVCFDLGERPLLPRVGPIGPIGSEPNLV